MDYRFSQRGAFLRRTKPLLVQQIALDNTGIISQPL